MKRATITLSDELEAELEAYRAAQAAPPSLTSLVQAALRGFLTARRPRRGSLEGPPQPSEIADEPVAYGAAGASSGGGAPWSRDDPPALRLRDLPGLLAGLPRLSDPQARQLADDLDRARKELERGTLRDPWSPITPSGPAGPDSGGG